ncbi:fungal-specific transcription factor domain-containing protein [Aspergillus pseudonomiae]|nr:fungal-specific transcription factor domain-containing protein [Aspergillus pseudonomiae]
MQSRQSAVRKNAGPRRRKIALACEPCRTRKARCDGQKPICGACRARGRNIDQCLYKTTDNARSASNDQYLRMLHHRIRELEETCTKAGVPVPAFGGESLMDNSLTAENDSGDASGLLDQAILSTTTSAQAQQHSPTHHTEPARSHPVNAHVYSPPVTETEIYPSTPFEPHSNVTGMGAISSVDESGRPVNEYFGSSSAVSLMRLLAKGSGRPHSTTIRNIAEQTPSPLSRREEMSSLTQGAGAPQSKFQVDELLLPPRDLADHLLDCFWDRIYCLYPFFHRQSLQDAYDNLWIGREQPTKPLSNLDIGLGNKNHSGSRSIVFICALNIIFALGCHFADMPVHEREAAAHTFFLRAKRFIGLDILDICSVGTVQCLLLAGLFLQSTPYPHRCWHSIGVACRVAQGLGLHEAQLDDNVHPLEQEIQRLTWHGCVMMDMFVSMTYGRPTMTSHLPSVPLPACSEAGSGEDQSPSVMVFYIATIELYRILDSILSDVYQVWWSKSSATPGGPIAKQGGLDVIISLEEKLFEYESNLPSFLNWTKPMTPTTMSAKQLILRRQRNVLHARFLYLHLLLYRPIFTQLCSDNPGRTHDTDRRRTTHSMIKTSLLTKCAAACVQAAISLISLVHDTHLDPATDTWWYNGFYISTAGMVIIMSYTCHPIWDELDKVTIDSTWAKCEEILRRMGSFSVSARNTIQFLQATRNQVLATHQQRPSAAACSTTANSQQQPQHISSQTNQIQLTGVEPLPHEGSGGLTWDASTEALAYDLGFLGPFDFNELHGLLPEWNA